MSEPQTPATEAGRLREAIANTLMDLRMDGPKWKPPSTLTYQEAMREYADIIVALPEIAALVAEPPDTGNAYFYRHPDGSMTELYERPVADEYKEATDAAMNYGEGYQAALREAWAKIERLTVETATGQKAVLLEDLDAVFNPDRVTVTLERRSGAERRHGPGYDLPNLHERRSQHRRKGDYERRVLHRDS